MFCKARFVFFVVPIGRPWSEPAGHRGSKARTLRPIGRPVGLGLGGVSWFMLDWLDVQVLCFGFCV